MSFRGDELIEGGTKGEMTNGKNYMEVRQYCEPSFLLRFYFVTRVYSPYMETVIADLVADHPPDIVMINSCLWDITRYCSCHLSIIAHAGNWCFIRYHTLI